MNTIIKEWKFILPLVISIISAIYAFLSKIKIEKLKGNLNRQYERKSELSEP